LLFLLYTLLLVVIKVDLLPLGLALRVVDLQPIGWLGLSGGRGLVWQCGLNSTCIVLQREWLRTLLPRRHGALGQNGANEGRTIDLCELIHVVV